MLSLAGATREQMAQMLPDLGCVIVGEEAAEDPEKPGLQIFERKRKARPPRTDNAPAPSQRRGAKQKDDRKAQNRKPKSAGGKPPSGQRRQAEKQPDPNSPLLFWRL